MSEEREAIVVEVRDVAFGGKGVARLPSGKTVFVRDVVAGERARVRVVKDGRRFAEAELVGLLEASPRRVRPECSYFGRCGGCAYQFIDYGLQLEVKRGQVEQVLKRIGGIAAPEVRDVVASPLAYGYRNRITVHARGERVGFYGRDGRTLVDIDRCPIASEPVNAALTVLRSERGLGEGAHTLREHRDRQGFHQTNDGVAPLLLAAVEEEVCGGGADRGGLLVDAYCGAGFFAKRMVDRFERVVGIEWNGMAVAAARLGAAANEEYMEGDVAERLAAVLGGESAETVAAAVVVLDPPAQGVDERVIAALRDRPVAKVIYVSCDPSTLARDLKLLAAEYELACAAPFDMFAQTAEVEVMAVLRRREVVDVESGQAEVETGLSDAR